MDQLDDNQLEVCAKQSDKQLNENYQKLRKMHKDESDKLKLLKDMQEGWIKMRDAQCEFTMRKVGSSAAIAGLTCEVALTQKRAAELADMSM